MCTHAYTVVEQECAHAHVPVTWQSQEELQLNYPSRDLKTMTMKWYFCKNTVLQTVKGRCGTTEASLRYVYCILMCHLTTHSSAVPSSLAYRYWLLSFPDLINYKYIQNACVTNLYFLPNWFFRTGEKSLPNSSLLAILFISGFKC